MSRSRLKNKLAGEIGVSPACHCAAQSALKGATTGKPNGPGNTVTKKPTTFQSTPPKGRQNNPKREAGIAMLKAGTATLHDVAILAGVSNQAVFAWIHPEKAGRVAAFDWQAKRRAWLEKQWRKQLAKVSAVDTLR